jgi:hypothetical protein
MIDLVFIIVLIGLPVLFLLGMYYVFQDVYDAWGGVGIVFLIVFWIVPITMPVMLLLTLLWPILRMCF